MAEALGLGQQSAYRRYHSGATNEEEYQAIVEQQRRLRQVVVNGTEYPNATAAARAEGLAYTAVLAMVEGQRPPATARLHPPYEWDGIEYATLRDMAKAHNITVGAARARLLKKKRWLKGLKNMPKQRAKTIWYDGIKFDSHAEGDRYLFLLSHQQSGIIAGLECHPFYVLQEAVNLPATLISKASRLQSVTYTPDFSYYYHGVLVIEDVKGRYGFTRANYANGKAGKPIIEASARLRHRLLIGKLATLGEPFVFVIVTEATYWHEELPKKRTRKNAKT